MKCYDCGAETSDFVMEERQVSGGDGVVYAGDFQLRPVHANRRDCIAERERQKIADARRRDSFYDVPAPPSSAEIGVSVEELRSYDHRPDEIMLPWADPKKPQ